MTLPLKVGIIRTPIRFTCAALLALTFLLNTPPALSQPIETYVGHEAMRIAAGPGYSVDDSAFYGLSFRAMLHDLADPSFGYGEFDQMTLLRIDARAYAESRSIQLENLIAFDVALYHPLGTADDGISWKARAGAVRVLDNGCNRCLAA